MNNPSLSFSLCRSVIYTIRHASVVQNVKEGKPPGKAYFHGILRRFCLAEDAEGTEDWGTWYLSRNGLGVAIKSLGSKTKCSAGANTRTRGQSIESKRIERAPALSERRTDIER